MTYTLNLKIEFKKLLVTFPSPLPLLYTVTFFSELIIGIVIIFDVIIVSGALSGVIDGASSSSFSVFTSIKLLVETSSASKSGSCIGSDFISASCSAVTSNVISSERLSLFSAEFIGETAFKSSFNPNIWSVQFLFPPLSTTK